MARPAAAPLAAASPRRAAPASAPQVLAVGAYNARADWAQLATTARARVLRQEGDAAPGDVPLGEVVEPPPLPTLAPTHVPTVHSFC